jgi:5,10-methylene-tetrahydrofolate dehydrogenase/methenyl tetrahydrofolate cyclohydrolase
VINGRAYAADLKTRVHGEHLPASAEEADVVAAVGKLDADPRVHGILVLRPLPRHIAEVAVYRELDPMKDTSRAGFLGDYTSRADILIVAAGMAALVRGEHVQPGVIAIDVGINPVEDPDSGKVHFVGDLDFESVATKASAISPVPEGVGPITDIWLLHNTVSAARLTAFVEPAQRSLDGVDIPQWDPFEARQ